MLIESLELYGKDLTESEDHFTIRESPVILTVKDLQIE